MRTLIKKVLFNSVFCFIFSWFFYIFHFKREEERIDCLTALKKYYNPQKSSCIREHNVINNHKYNLQIVIPCYNVDKFLNKCIDSILRKTTNYLISIILIDDGSTDNTSKICDKYAAIDSRIVVIHQQNKGFSGARNSGLDLINSDFLMFIDSDDYLDANFDLDGTLNKAYQLNKNVNDTILEFGFIRERDNIFFGKCLPKKGYIRPSNYKGFAWGKIFPSNIFSNIKFPLNYWFEDTFIKMIVLFLNNVKCFGTPIVGYVYKDNKNSITHNYRNNKKSLDSFYIMSSLLEDAKELNIEFSRFYSDTILWQVVCTYTRTKHLEKNIKRSIFYNTVNLFNKYKFSQPISKKYYYLYKSILNKDIKAYNSICSLLCKSK